MMEKIETLLNEQPFLKGLTKEQYAALAKFSEAVQFEDGKYIYREGEEATSFFLIRNGRVSIEIFAAQRGVLTIQTANAGDVLGWSWLVPPHNWRFSGRAIDLVQAIRVDGKKLLKLCQKDHELGYQILSRLFQVVTQRLEATRLQLLDLYGNHS